MGMSEEGRWWNLTEREEKEQINFTKLTGLIPRLFFWTSSQTRGAYSITLGGKLMLVQRERKVSKWNAKDPIRAVLQDSFKVQNHFALDYTFYSRCFHLHLDLAFLLLVQVLLSLLQMCNLLALIAVVLIRGSPAAKRCFGNLCVCLCVGGVICGCPMIKRLSWHVVSGESGG